MDKTLLTILMFVFLLLFITSPFAGLASLMLVLLVAAFFSLLGSLFQGIFGSKTDPNKS